MSLLKFFASAQTAILVAATSAMGQSTQVEVRLTHRLDEPSFSASSLLTVDANGKIFVLDRGQGALQLINLNPTRTQKVGGDSRLPSGRVLASIATMGWSADTLWMWSPGVGRLFFFDTAGSPIRADSVPRVRNRFPDTFFAPRAMTADGSLILEETAGSYGATHLMENGQLLLRVARLGSHIDTIARLDYRDAVLVLEVGDDGMLVWQQPWSSHDLSVFAPDGSRIVVVNRRQEPSSSVRRYQVTVLDHRGRTALSRTYFDDLALLTASMVRERIDEIVSQRLIAEFSSQAAARIAVEAALHKPLVLPPIITAIVGRDGVIWLRRNTVDPASSWRMIDGSGVVKFEITLPANVDVQAVTANKIWGLERGVDGRLRVVVFRVMGFAR